MSLASLPYTAPSNTLLSSLMSSSAPPSNTVREDIACDSLNPLSKLYLVQILISYLVAVGFLGTLVVNLFSVPLPVFGTIARGTMVGVSFGLAVHRTKRRGQAREAQTTTVQEREGQLSLA